MVVQGHETTLPVTLDEMAYHCRAVARAVRRAHVIGDMPFMTYQTSIEQGLANAGKLIKEGGCSSIKLEGGAVHAELVHRLVSAGIPVMGHIGLTPQSFHQMGGFKVQGREAGGRDKLLADARALADAGAYAIVLEAIPADIAREVTASVDVPTIGIGAGTGCAAGPGVVRHARHGRDVQAALRAPVRDARRDDQGGDRGLRRRGARRHVSQRRRVVLADRVATAADRRAVLDGRQEVVM
jgi:3-methyl-2-oxobutanoate hydroxymethyltransferase